MPSWPCAWRIWPASASSLPGRARRAAEVSHGPADALPERGRTYIIPPMTPSEILALLAEDPILGALYSYWNRRRGGRRMPDRRDIDPLELGPALLPHVGLMDIVDAGARVRYRLLGTAIVERFGIDPTGRFHDEVMSGSYRDYIHSLYGKLHRARAPVFSESLFRWDKEGFLRTRRIYLPLTHGGEEVAIALIGQVFLGPATDPVRPYSVIVEESRVVAQSGVLEPPEAR